MSSIRAHRHWWDFLQPTFDAIAIVLSAALVKWAVKGVIDDKVVIAGMIATVVFLLLSQLTGLQRKFGSGSADNEMSGLAVTWTLTVLVMSMIAFATRYGQEFARSVILAWIIVAPSMIGFFRMSIRLVQNAMNRRGIGVRRVAIAGFNQLGLRTAHNIEQDPSIGFRMVGFYDDRKHVRPDDTDKDTKPMDASGPESEQPLSADHPLHGGLDALVAAAKAGEIDTVLITLPMRAEARIRGLLDQLSDTTASVYIVPDFFVFELLHSRWTNMGGLPAVSVFENPLFGVDGIAKRLFDVTVACAALLCAAVPMTLIAIAVKVTSRGPVFFRQKRYGLDGKEILVWKFRSMRTCDNGPVVKQATKDDPRITPLGGILRKTSLDELPQLFNVIDGSMSLVGPRPHATAHNEQYRGQIRGYMLRHKIKPGITGLAQVNGCRGETETIDKMEKRVHFDHQYIRSWSIWLDLKIMFKTLLVVWTQPEAR
ncbi:undecaprenyl-phosphate glucose phosphotransferase [Crateriforma conspicua]|uniref:UDP-glucose:undecaprenyl-phosphate glucose-1-phosphate transferase n=1 Tax=Crateriforma conspicua TaxID=2527996 RepID=A0A5C6FX94_9PLAN|nr:undecaprenyl-phosphate glucose phosphotransferase [Crateriforma conspicua]TWU65663.1 UDP-glucose:undecaprenyl-phosphate glucose-1-phosphate transferase [Crateriforma conspicua]